MSFGRDYPEDYTTVTILFTTQDGNGAPVAPSSAFEAADVTIYKNGSSAKATTNGVTMTSPLNSKTGLHAVIIDTSNDTGDSGFWTTGGGSVYSVVLDPDTETVNGQTVRKTIGDFSICVSPVNWNKVAAPTTTVNLSGTTVKTATDIETDTQDIQSRLPSALTGAGNIKADAQVVSDKTGYALSTGGVQAIWDALTSALTTVGSIGKRLADNVDAAVSTRSSHAAADIWAVTSRLLSAGTNIVLAKGTGVTGFNDLDAAGVRTAVGLGTANLDTQLDALPTNTELATALAAADDATLAQIALVKAKTDNLPSDPADASDIATAFGVVGSAISGLNDLSQADVRTAVGLASADLDTQIGTLATASDLAAVKDVTDRLDGMIEDSTGDRFTAHALEAAPSGGSAPTADDNATAVWAALKADNTVTGSFGEAVAGTQGDVQSIGSIVSSIASGAAADMNTAIRVEIDANSAKLSAIGSGVDAINAFDASLVQTAGKLWVLDQDGNPIASGVTPAPSADEIADEVATRTLNANITQVNGDAVAGDGTTGSPWGPV